MSSRFLGGCLMVAGVYCIYLYNERNNWKRQPPKPPVIRSSVDYSSDCSNPFQTNLPLKHLSYGYEDFR